MKLQRFYLERNHLGQFALKQLKNSDKPPYFLIENVMINVITILGARPQFIKAAAVSQAIKKSDTLSEAIVHTGQHHDIAMSDIFFEELGIPAPNFHLNVNGGGHGNMTGVMLQRLEPLLLEQSPDLVLVYGDTNSTLAGALAASKLHIPVAHVEAGLRSFNRQMPEEQNRILTDHISDWLFSSTDTATANLQNEGLGDRQIHQVGDVMYDAALLFGNQARNQRNILERCGVPQSHYILATVHRAENTDNPIRLRAIIQALDGLAQDYPVVLPLHPRTHAALERQDIVPNNITCIDPVGYLDMVGLECQAAAIATDSGGVQKEAYFHGVPCVTLRNETEWVELIEMGWNRLARPGEDDIEQSIRDAIGSGGVPGSPYGDGDAATRIIEILSN